MNQKQPLVQAGTATLMDYDDLAVSQHKLGDHKAAIATMMAKEKKKPDVYETASNLGTFYISTGELTTAVKWIEKALAINPNAHFGREKYQRWLVLWILEKKTYELSLEQVQSERDFTRKRSMPVGFANFVARQEMGIHFPGSTLVLRFTEAQRKAAVTGVAGMMYFADFNNPYLQEAMGDLLSFGDIKEGAPQLAAVCYLQAAQKAATAEDRERLKLLSETEEIASRAKRSESMAVTLQKALEKNQELIDGVRADELAWIAAGKDATAEFQKKYLRADKGA